MHYSTNYYLSQLFFLSMFTKLDTFELIIKSTILFSTSKLENNILLNIIKKYEHLMLIYNTIQLFTLFLAFGNYSLIEFVMGIQFIIYAVICQNTNELHKFIYLTLCLYTLYI